MTKLLHIMFMCTDNFFCCILTGCKFQSSKPTGINAFLGLEWAVPSFNVKILLSHSFIALCDIIHEKYVLICTYPLKKIVV